MTNVTDNDFVTRALAAYFRSGGTPPPTSEACNVTAHEDRRYVVLRGASSIVAVYRIRNDGMLKRLTRWPDAIDTGKLDGRYEELRVYAESQTGERAEVLKGSLEVVAKTYQIDRDVRHGVREGWIEPGSELARFAGVKVDEKKSTDGTGESMTERQAKAYLVISSNRNGEPGVGPTVSQLEAIGKLPREDIWPVVAEFARVVCLGFAPEVLAAVDEGINSMIRDRASATQGARMFEAKPDRAAKLAEIEAVRAGGDTEKADLLAEVLQHIDDLDQNARLYAKIQAGE